MSEEQRFWQEPGGSGPYGEPALDPASARRDTVGRTLRRAREREGLNLRDISDALRIRHDYLDAIERSDFDRLPGPTYAIGFVRGYASYLQLDDQEIVRRFKEEVAGLDRAQDLHFPEPVNEGKVPGGVLLLVSVLLIGLAYGGWYYLSSSGETISDMVPPVPERLQALLDGAPDSSATAADAPGGSDTGGSDTGGASGRDTQGTQPSASGSAETASDTTGSPSPAPSAPDTGGETQAAGGDASSAPASEPATEPGAEGAPDAATASPGETQTAAAPESDSPAPAAPDPDTTTDASPAPEAPSVPGADGADGIPEAPAPDDTTNAADATGTAPEAPTGADTAVEDTTGDTSGDSGATQSAALPEPPSDTDTANEPTNGAPAAADGPQASLLQDAERVFGEGNAGSRVLLRATQDSWVQVRGPDNGLLISRVLNPGDVYRVPDRGGLVMHTGNAGGLRVYVDGQLAGGLGETGEVRRNIDLAPESLR